MSVKDMLARKLKFNEMRRYRRMALDLPVKVVVNGIDEYEGRLLNISPGDLAVKVEADVVAGDAVVLYIETLDVIEGRIVRSLPDGFAVSFLLSRRRRALLTEQLMLKTNPGMTDGLDDRRQTPRHNAGDQRMVCRLPDGASLFVRVIDMSVDGIAVEAPRKPSVGTAIHVGRMAGIVVRHTPRGFVVVYERQRKDDATQLRVVKA